MTKVVGTGSMIEEIISIALVGGPAFACSSSLEDDKTGKSEVGLLDTLEK